MRYMPILKSIWTQKQQQRRVNVDVSFLSEVEPALTATAQAWICVRR
jgi:hypothetical protein